MNSVLETQSTVEKELKDLKDQLTDLRSRSMRKNLVITNVPETADDISTETIVKKFLKEKIKVDPHFAENIEVARAHRFGKSRAQKPRPIVIRFEKFKEKMKILEHGKNLKGTSYGVNEQFPQEIMEKRSKLFPILRKCRNNNIKAVIRVDKLYVRNNLFNPEIDSIARLLTRLQRRI